MEKFRQYIDMRLAQYDMTAGALASSFYYVGGEGRYTELKAFAEQYRKIYYQTHPRK